jgi:hypothetical protein
VIVRAEAHNIDELDLPSGTPLALLDHRLVSGRQQQRQRYRRLVPVGGERLRQRPGSKESRPGGHREQRARSRGAGWGLAAALLGEQAADGQVTYPMGTDALGSLLYTADGRFSVTISRRGRAGFAAGDLLGGTTEEKPGSWGAMWPTRAATASMATASSTTGTVAVPNWVGTDQQRSVELSGDRLTLSASPLLLAGTQQVPRLVWERVDPFPRVG